MSKKGKRLQELRGSDFEVAKGQPDIRGWEVRDHNGHLLGKVNELIFDSRAHKVRYMVVNILDSKELQLEKRSVLIPIGMAVLQPQDDDVILDDITPFQLRALPRYDKDDLGTRAERAISTVFGRTDNKGGNAQTDDQELEPDFYEHEHFNEDNMYKRRSGAAGGGATPLHGSSSSSNAQAASYERETEIKRETEIRPLSDHSSYNKGDQSFDNDATSIRDTEMPQQKGETDEEYIRRARKNIDNRDH
jgi:sporulation protein YlmC with PRC-barrel domain